MAKEKYSSEKESSTERLSRWGRNFNALGALAIAGVAAVIPGPNVVLTGWAALNAVQAGGFEWARQAAKKSRKKKSNQRQNRM